VKKQNVLLKKKQSVLRRKKQIVLLEKKQSVSLVKKQIVLRRKKQIVSLEKKQQFSFRIRCEGIEPKERWVLVAQRSLHRRHKRKQSVLQRKNSLGFPKPRSTQSLKRNCERS
jgi:vesicle coat complex subunit